MDTQQFLQHLETVLNGCLETAKKKNADYSGGKDPFANFVMCEKLNITSTEKGILTRLCDKLSRINTLLEQEAQVKDESIFDTIEDSINYLAILHAYLSKNK